MVLSFRFLASLESASSLEVGGDASPFAEPSPGIWRRCSSIGVSSGVLNPLLAPPPRVVSCARRIVTDARSAGASASASASAASWSASTAFGEAAAAAATAAASACWHSCTTFEGTNMAPRAERAGDAECVTAGGDGAARNERWRACCTCTEVVVVVVVASPSGEAVEAAALDEAVEASSTSAGGCATTTAVPCTGSRSATSSTLTAASGRLRLLGRACSVSMTFGSVALHFLPVRSTSLIVSPKVLAMSSVRPASLASLISVTLCRDSARRPTAPPEGEAGDERAGTAWNMSATCLVRDSRSCDSLSDSSFDGAAAAGSSVGVGDGDESEGLLSGERGTMGEVGAGDCLCAVDGDADGELVVGDVGDAAVAVAAAAAASAVEVVGPDAARASNGELAFLRSIEGDEATSRIVGDADVLVLVFVGSALAVAAAAAADLLLLIPLPLREDELDVDADGVLPLLLLLDESFEDDLSFLCRDEEDDSLSLELESDDDEPPVVPERFLRSLSFGLLVDEGSLDSFESLERDGDGLEADDDDDDEIESAELLPPLLLSVRLRLRSLLLLLLLPLESFSSLSLSFLCLEDFLWRRGASLEAPPSPLAVAAAAAASSVPVAVAMRRSSSDMASESASRSHCHRLSHSHSLPPSATRAHTSSRE